MPLLLVLICQLNLAQEKCTLKGTVVDSLALPVYDASVTAFNANNKGEGFAFTDVNGEFKLVLPCNQTYEIEVEHANYQSLLEKINITKNTKKQLVVKNTSVQLDEALVKARVPITVKGDTIEYDADSFKTGSEETLEDVLKKLPGIEVEDGKVYHQGKEIKSIKVEGREIFGGNTKLLNKNLPSDAVDKIQLNKKFKANPFANSLQDDEQPELNIVLKEDKKNLIFGNMTLGGDANTHTNAQEKLFYFNPKTDATLITDYNTYGKQVFTNEDYFSFLGGVSEFQEEGSSFSLRNSANNILFGNNQNANQLSNFLNAFHVGFEPNDKLYMNAFTLINNNRINYNSQTDRIFDFTQTDISRTEQTIFTGTGRFRLDYSPNNRTQIKYRNQSSYVNNEQNQNVTTNNSLTNDELFRDMLNKRKSFGMTQKLTFLRKVGEDDNFGLYLRHQYQDERPDWQMNATNSPFPIFNLTPQEAVYNLNQQQQLTSQILQIYTIYNHLLSNTSNLRIKTGGNFSWQDFNNQILSFNQQVTPSNPNPEFNLLTDSDFEYNELYADLTYTKKFWKITIDAGLGVNYFKDTNQGLGYNTNINQTRVLPHLNVELDINSSERLNLSYKQEYNLPQVKELSESYQINNFFSLFLGNQDLRPALYHNISANYNQFNAFQFSSFYIGANYNQRVDNLLTATLNNIDQSTGFVTQINQTINSPQTEESLSGYMGYNKKFSRKYGIRFRANAAWNSAYTILDNDLINNISITQNYTFTNNFKYKKKIELNVGMNFSMNDFRSNINNQFTNYKPFADLAYAINKKLLLKTDYSYEAQFANGDFLNKVNLLSASIRFKPIKKVYLLFTAGNLLNNNQIVNSSFNNNFTQVNRVDLLGRYLIGSVRYKF